MKFDFRAVAGVLGLVVSMTLYAQDATPADAADAPSDAEVQARSFLQSLTPQHGEVQLPGGLAKLTLNDNFYYLNSGDAGRLLTEAWGNPPGSAEGVLGMIVPADVSPLSKSGWGVVITYADDGHVSDEDADKINYADVLKDMQEASSDANEERKKAGYGEVNLVGWAESPHYDHAAHKIYWAKNLAFSGSDENTLNYFVRVLGRKGVLELNAVSGMKQLSEVKRSMGEVVGFAEFTAGNRYEDFNSSTDKVAAYGLAALVAGGIAAKTGLLAKVGALLLAGKKLIVVLLAGIAGAFRKLFGGKKQQ